MWSGMRKNGHCTQLGTRVWIMVDIHLSFSMLCRPTVRHPPAGDSRRAKQPSCWRNQDIWGKQIVNVQFDTSLLFSHFCTMCPGLVPMEVTL